MILRLAALGALGYGAFKYFEQQKRDNNGVAFAKGEPEGAFRNAGSDATRTHDKMSKTDEELDETYPASDPPANY
ncbi:hypothetical protein [Qipengyuania sp. JC766]|uniref:hypothetical protein n=1 Tax=Qipengyuania sp. JC766 TaxID=3232139 RepID=UPI003459D975